MVEGKRKSRSKRIVKVRVPGSKSTTQYRKRKPAKAKCAECGDVLKGVLRARATKLKHVSKSQKRPSRPFGGKLCTKCMRKEIVKRAKNLSKE